MLRSTLLASCVLVSSLGLSSRIGAQSLDLVNGGFPDVNCLFDTACRLTVLDSIGIINLPSTQGDGRLQSRSAGPGAAGTAGEGMYLYLYRVDLMSVDAIGEFTDRDLRANERPDKQ